MNIELKKIDDAFNPFNSNEISNELDKYITDACLKGFKNIKELNIKCNLTKKEQEKLEETVHNYYKDQSKGLNNIDKYDNYIQIILLLLGLLLILISKETTTFLSEILLITGWVFVWELLYDVLFNQIKRKRKANIYKKLSKCKINFI